MLGVVTGEDVAAEAKMVRSAFKGAILLVEGDKDVLFFERFTDSDDCILIPSRGKENLLHAIQILESERFRGAVGIVDADLWNILGQDCPSQNICITDHHDIEIMVLDSDALIHILREYGSPEKIKDFKRVHDSKDIRQALYNAVVPIGILRLISQKQELGLNFKGLKYDRIIDRDRLEVVIDKLIPTVLSMSGFPKAITEVKEKLEKESETYRNTDRRQLCCGHDVLAVLCIGLRKALGTLDSKTAHPDNLDSVLRLAYDSSSLSKTELYLCIKQWETCNPSYKVFAI
jgi:hypothetical protein